MHQLKTVFLSSVITTILISIVLAYFYYNGTAGSTSTDKDTFISEQAPESLNIKTVEYKPEATETKRSMNDQISNSRQNIITNTVSDVSPAVVGINVTEIRYYRDAWSSDPFFRRYFGDRVYKQEVKGLGSGVIISPDGYILTNDHVAGNASKIIVTMTNGKHYNASIVGTDPESDVCLVKIDAENLPYVTLGDSDKLIIGEWVIALGNPFGLFAINDKPTVTVGVISATEMNLGTVEGRYYLSMIQTDAAINGGNSGGPLVNSMGQLIGINTLIYSPNSQGGSVGVGFALPINKVKVIAEELKNNGKIDRNFWTGLNIQSIDESIAKYYKLATTRGVIVTNIIKNSPAHKAGIQVGDIIQKVGNFIISDDSSLIAALKEYRTGDNVTIKILRNDSSIKKIMTLEGRND